MLSYRDSLNVLKKTRALLEGHFILSSGLHSDKYVQCARLLSNPNHASKICKSLVEKISKSFYSIDLILSPALGGIVVGYEIGRQLNIITIFAERIEGKLTLRRGFDIFPNTNVLIVEDVITTGKSVLECKEIVKRNKANLVGYACIIDRTGDEKIIEDKIISQIKMKMPTFKENELPEELRKIAVQKPGSRNLTK